MVLVHVTMSFAALHGTKNRKSLEMYLAFSVSDSATSTTMLMLSFLKSLMMLSSVG